MCLCIRMYLCVWYIYIYYTRTSGFRREHRLVRILGKSINLRNIRCKWRFLAGNIVYKRWDFPANHGLMNIQDKRILSDSPPNRRDDRRLVDPTNGIYKKDLFFFGMFLQSDLLPAHKFDNFVACHLKPLGVGVGWGGVGWGMSTFVCTCVMKLMLRHAWGWGWVWGGACQRLFALASWSWCYVTHGVGVGWGGACQRALALASWSWCYVTHGVGVGWGGAC